MKRVFGKVEAVFDILYLLTALAIGTILFATGIENHGRTLAGAMAFVLAGGDAFHLIPRIRVVITGDEEKLRTALGRGKQITSVTMTVFYLILWQILEAIAEPAEMNTWSAALYAFAGIRILLCLLPQNRWCDRYPPAKWSVLRNVPFVVVGGIVAIQFFMERGQLEGLSFMWLATLLSFGFYLPVTLWANRNPKIGMLMLPKTCAYIWMLIMCLSL